MNKRSFVALLLLVSLLVISACGTNNNAKSGKSSGEKLSITIADTVSNPIFQVALAKGIFEKHNIDAKIATFATPAEGINALFINQVNIAYGADFPVLNAIGKGDYAIIASTGSGLSDKDAANWKLFVRDDIQSAADLKGKKLSTLRGTFLSYLWDEYLQQNGLTSADVEIIGQGGFDESLVALKSGDIDAVWVTGAAILDKFSSIEGVHQLTDMSQTSVRIGGQIVAPTELVTQNPEGIKNLYKALEESYQFIQDSPEEVADIMYEKVKQPRDMTLADLKIFVWDLQFTDASVDGLNKQKKYLVEQGIIEQDFEINSKLQINLLKEVFPERVTYEP